MSTQAIDPRAEVDTPANVQPVQSGEADPSMTVSPDTQDDDLRKAVAVIALGALVEQYNDIEKKLRRFYELRGTIEYRINEIARESGIKLPFHCAAGSIHKGYASDRTRNPRRYKLRARRTFIGPKKRVVVERAA